MLARSGIRHWRTRRGSHVACSHTNIGAASLPAAGTADVLWLMPRSSTCLLVPSGGPRAPSSLSRRNTRAHDRGASASCIVRCRRLPRPCHSTARCQRKNAARRSGPRSLAFHLSAASHDDLWQATTASRAVRRAYPKPFRLLHLQGDAIRLALAGLYARHLDIRAGDFVAGIAHRHSSDCECNTAEHHDLSSFVDCPSAHAFISRHAFLP